jgi:hypothetical protein
VKKGAAMRLLAGALGCLLCLLQAAASKQFFKDQPQGSASSLTNFFLLPNGMLEDKSNFNSFWRYFVMEFCGKYAHGRAKISLSHFTVLFCIELSKYL